MAHASNSPSCAAPPRALAAATVALALLASPLAALAAPQLQCSFDVNSETHHKVFGLVTDPYTTEAVAIGNRFRFKAVMLAGEGGAGVQSLNLYVYYNTRRQPMIMQHTRFLQPTVLPQPAPDALTGRVSLYFWAKSCNPNVLWPRWRHEGACTFCRAHAGCAFARAGPGQLRCR